MRRRQLLGSVATLGTTAAAGCQLPFGNGSGSDVVLDAPDDRQFDSEELPYPAYGQSLPSFSLPNPLTGETIATDALDETLVVTGFFATCPAECVQLIGQLAGVQHGTIENGLGDAVRFLAITFDPERDDATALREYAARMRIDMDAGNWEFLRPQDPAAAKRVVEEKLGITFERVEEGQSSRVAGYDFTHLSLTLLVNPEGYVERAYRTSQPDADQVLADLQRVVDRSS